MQFDSARATRVYGDSRATWYCDGQYFDGRLNPISHEEAALPQPKVVEEAEPKSTELPSYTVVAAPKAPPEPEEHVAIVDPPVKRETATDATYGTNRRLKLKALTGTVLAGMVLRAGGTTESGQGSKKKNLEWLLENVPE